MVAVAYDVKKVVDFTIAGVETNDVEINVIFVGAVVGLTVMVVGAVDGKRVGGCVGIGVSNL